MSVMDECTDAPDAAEGRKRGRPRSTEVDETVLAATLDLAREVGITKMSMDELAERARVSKATIYRRWPSKELLVLDALRSGIRPLDDLDTNSLAGDLDAYLSELVVRARKGRMADVLPHLIEVACHDEGIRSSLDDYIASRRQPLRRILTRAIDRGELAADVDVEVVIDALVGPFMYRQLLSRHPIDDDFVRRLLAVVLPDLGR